MKTNPLAASGRKTNGQRMPRTYDDVLASSISEFLGRYSKGFSDFSHLLFLFRGMLWGQKDPRLDILWFSAAVEYHCCRPSEVPPPAKFLIVQKQFKLLKYHTSECSAVKKVAALAPVLCLLYNLDLNFSAEDPCLRKDISSLVEEIFAYLSSCSELMEKGEQCSAGLGVHILWLIKVWGADNPDKYFMELFFPILNAKLREKVTSCFGNLAGVVFNETLLLRFRLRLCQENNEEYLQNDTRKLAVQTIKSFHNIYFLDLLYKMLSEPKLPAAASLCSVDAILLRKSMYDAVILFDHSFYSGKWIGSLDSRTKRLAVDWVMVCKHAILFSREIADGYRASYYRNAFDNSQLVAALLEWASSEEDLMQANARPHFLTPESLVKWLLTLERHEKRVACSSNGTEAATAGLSGKKQTQKECSLPGKRKKARRQLPDASTSY